MIAWFIALPKWVKGAAAIVAGALLLWGAWSLWLWQHDRGVIKEHEAEREAKAAPAREDASNERVNDALRNTRQEERYHEAINDAPPAPPEAPAIHPASRALACERLRRIGRTPPACGPEGRGGTEADPI